MQLLKTRNFSGFINDSFGFLKENFWHLLSNYMKISVIFLIVILICAFPLIGAYIEMIQSALTQTNPDPLIMQEHMLGFLMNPALYGLIIMSCIYYVVILTFVPIYFKLYQVNDGNNFSFSDIMEAYKENGKAILTMIGFLILLSIPIYIALSITAVISIFTIVGIFLFIGFIISYPQLMWFNVIHNNSGKLDIFSKTFLLYKTSFMNIVGATLVMYIIMTAINYAFSILFMIIGGMFTTFNPQNLENPADLANTFNEIGPTIIGFYLLLLAISLILTILLQVQQGIIFYSRINELEGHSVNSEIDSIGQNESL